MVWNAARQWWDFQKPIVEFGTLRIVWATYVIICPDCGRVQLVEWLSNGGVGFSRF